MHHFRLAARLNPQLHSSMKLHLEMGSALQRAVAGASWMERSALASRQCLEGIIFTFSCVQPNIHCPLICIKHQLLFPIERGPGLSFTKHITSNPVPGMQDKNKTKNEHQFIYRQISISICLTLFSGGFQFSAEVAAEVGAQGQWTSCAGE